MKAPKATDCRVVIQLLKVKFCYFYLSSVIVAIQNYDIYFNPNIWRPISISIPLLTEMYHTPNFVSSEIQRDAVPTVTLLA